MCPTHETDESQHRWTQSEWQHYELFEKTEARQQRKKRLWIAGTVLAFLFLSAWPIARESIPKWKTLVYARRLSQQINRMKFEAIVSRTPHRIEFSQGLGFKIEQVAGCGADAQALEVIRQGSLRSGAIELTETAAVSEQYLVLDGAQAAALGVGQISNHFCYDPLRGGEGSLAIALRSDLQEQRLDRISLVSIHGPLSEPVFE